MRKMWCPTRQEREDEADDIACDIENTLRDIADLHREQQRAISISPDLADVKQFANLYHGRLRLSELELLAELRTLMMRARRVGCGHGYVAMQRMTFEELTNGSPFDCDACFERAAEETRGMGAGETEELLTKPAQDDDPSE